MIKTLAQSAIALFLPLALCACRSGGVKTLDTNPPDTDADADTDTDTDADTDADTDPCPWDGSWSGVTTLVSDTHEWECDTQATIQDCQIDGVASCPMRGGTDLAIDGETVGSEASGWISGSLGGMGSVDAAWLGGLDSAGLVGTFLSDDGAISGEIALTAAD